MNHKYCGKCGSEIKEDSILCPRCGERIINNNENVTLNQLRNGCNNKISAEKCAWFAPVSVIISALLFFGARTLIAKVIMPNFQTPEGYYTGIGYQVTMAVQTIIQLLIPLIVSIVVFSIAASGLEQKIRKKVAPSLFLPIFFYFIPFYLSGALQTGLFGTDISITTLY